jgi:aryl sulfotransferase
VPVRYYNVVADSARWNGFDFRDGDIVISTPPKCGTTWTQMVCALLIFQTPDLPAPLTELSPWLDMLTRSRDAVVADLEAQTHRRFITTHTPLDGLPFVDRVTYICVGRDPRDVGCSWDNHMTNLDIGAVLEARQAAVGLDDLAELMPDGPPARPDSEIERFMMWVDNQTELNSAGGLQALLHHQTTFWEVRDRPNVILMRYEDLKADLGGEMRRLAERLDLTVADELWPGLVEGATFERMRERADQLVPGSTIAIWQDNRQFFHRGTTGQWKDVLSPADVDRYEARVAELVAPDLAAWLHGS